MLEQFEGRRTTPVGGNGGDVSAPSGSPFLEGATVTVAGAALLEHVTAAIARLGGNVQSSQIDLQGNQSKSGFITMIASCDIDQPGLQRLLYDLEAGMPFLFVDQLVVQTADRACVERRRQAAGSAQRLRAMAGREMRQPKTIRPRSLRLSIMLAAVLSLPASTTALSIAASDMELDPAPRAADGPATPSIWATPAPIEVRPAPPKPAPPPRPLSANPLWAIPLATLSNTRERPIFSPSRRPPPAQTPVAVAAPPAPPPAPPRVERPPLALVGTVAGDDESFGIFVDKATSTALRLKVGEDYQGWRLRGGAGTRRLAGTRSADGGA